MVDMFAYDNMVIVIENCALQFHLQPKKTITCCLKEQELFHFQKSGPCVIFSFEFNSLILLVTLCTNRWGVGCAQATDF